MFGTVSPAWPHYSSYQLYSWGSKCCRSGTPALHRRQNVVVFWLSIQAGGSPLSMWQETQDSPLKPTEKKQTLQRIKHLHPDIFIYINKAITFKVLVFCRSFRCCYTDFAKNQMSALMMSRGKVGWTNRNKTADKEECNFFDSQTFHILFSVCFTCFNSQGRD